MRRCPHSLRRRGRPSMRASRRRSRPAAALCATTMAENRR